MADYIKLKDDEKPKKTPRRTINFTSILIIIIVIFIISSLVSTFIFSITPKIAVVPITGIISTERSTSIYGDTISSREIATILRELQKDSSVKAILLDINSPGGSPVASEEISKAINELKTEKPVYALVNDVGASGAFWIAVSADKIYASKMSTLGSIGVTSAGLGFEQFIKDWNVTYRRQVAGEFKDMGTPFREPTQTEEEMIQQILDDIHIMFIEHVAKERNMTFEQVSEYSDGSIFLGTKALEIGFIDEIGLYPDAIADIENISNSKGAMVIEYGPQPTFAEALGLNTIFNIPKTESQIMIKK